MPISRRPVRPRWLVAAVLGLVVLTGVLAVWPTLSPAAAMALIDAQWLHARQAEVLAWHAAEPVTRGVASGLADRFPCLAPSRKLTAAEPVGAKTPRAAQSRRRA